MEPKTILSRSYFAHRLGLTQRIQPLVLGYVEVDVLDAISDAAAAEPDSVLHSQMMRLLQLLDEREQLEGSAALREEFQRLYNDSVSRVLPLASLYLK
jgi:hypothetical protein